MRNVKILGVLVCAFTLSLINVHADETIQSRIDSATGETTITLEKNYTETITVGINKKIILNLNGYTLTGNISVENGELTVNDSTNTGKIITTTNIPVSNGKFTLNGGNITSNNYGIYGLNDSLITINGGSITAKNDNACLSSNNTTGDATFVINGGTFNANWQTVYLANPVGLTITGGTFNGGIAMRMGKLTITGGTINATIANANEFDNIKDYYNLNDGYAWTPDAIHFMAGTYTTTSPKGNALEVNITGGNINVANGLGSAVVAYDMGKVEQSATINISSGAKLTTNATNRSAVDVMSLSDIGVTNPQAGYGVYSGHIKVNMIGGVYSDEPAEELIPEGYNAYKVIEGDNEDKYVVVKEEELEAEPVSGPAPKESLPEAEVALIEEALKDKFQLVSFYGVDVAIVTPEGDVIGYAEELETPVEVTFGIPTTLPAVKTGFTRKYYVIRVHNGKVTIIDNVTVNEDGTITFKSDKFSTYALAYDDVKEETVKSPATYDGIATYIGLSIISVIFLLSFLSVKRKFDY